MSSNNICHVQSWNAASHNLSWEVKFAFRKHMVYLAIPCLWTLTHQSNFRIQKEQPHFDNLIAYFRTDYHLSVTCFTTKQLNHVIHVVITSQWYFFSPIWPAATIIGVVCLVLQCVGVSQLAAIYSQLQPFNTPHAHKNLKHTMQY